VHYLIADPVRVIDDQGREVPADGESLGEVLMRGNNVMTGYFEDSEQTRETLADGLRYSGRRHGVTVDRQPGRQAGVRECPSAHVRRMCRQPSRR